MRRVYSLSPVAEALTKRYMEANNMRLCVFCGRPAWIGWDLCRKCIPAQQKRNAEAKP